MHYTSRGAGRALFIALLAISVLLCAAFSVTASKAAPRAAHAKTHANSHRHANAAAVRAHEHGRRLTAARKRMHRLTAMVVRAALSQRGVPYHWGGGSPAAGFDCSGLVAWSFARIGIQLPHSSYMLARLGRGVSLRALRPGDVLVFHHASHVGLYIGRGLFVHAPHSGTTVSVTALAGRYRSGLDTARRVAIHT